MSLAMASVRQTKLLSVHLSLLLMMRVLSAHSISQSTFCPELFKSATSKPATVQSHKALYYGCESTASRQFKLFLVPYESIQWVFLSNGCVKSAALVVLPHELDVSCRTAVAFRLPHKPSVHLNRAASLHAQVSAGDRHQQPYVQFCMNPSI